MKNNVLRLIRKSVSFMMAIALVISGCLVIPTNAEAAEGVVADTIDEVRYVEYDVEDCTLGQAPTYSGVDENYGYLFGGWYTYDSAEKKYSPITIADDMKDAVKVYAKFVPAYVLSIKCQNFAGTLEGSTSTNMRIVSSLDSLNYQKVGFDLMKIVKNSDGTWTEKVLGTNGGQSSTKTYWNFELYDSETDTEPDIYTPQQIFGNASKYLTAWRVNKISKANFGTIICVRPYWVTLDGVTVYGLSKYAHVEDGYLEYINVPVNLYNAKDVAAGLLNVTYDTTKLEFVDTECGRVFQEMTSIVEKDDSGALTGKVKCVGNVGDISTDAGSDHIYINLRFKAIDGAEFGDGISAFDFNVSGESFSNVAETLLEGSDYNVWKVKTSILK